MRPQLNNEESLMSLVKALSSRELDPAIRDALHKTNVSSTGASKSEALNKLERNPLFVVTGQQVGLFGGPLLTFYKAVTAIRAARDMERRLGRPVVPIFWLQSEDHDLAEIDTVTLQNSNGVSKALSTVLTTGFPTSGSLSKDGERENKRSVSKVKLHEGVLDALNELAATLEGAAYSAGLVEVLRSAYAPGSTWNESFLKLYQLIFADTELLFFDLQLESLKSLPDVRDVFERCIKRQSEVESLLLASSRENRIENGVQLRENSPIFFFELDSGDRRRLLKEEGSFGIKKDSPLLTESQLLECLAKEPWRFSTSALLRPLVQDTIFPTLAYIGGDAELTYHRQLDKVYSEFNLPLPLLLSRAKFRLLGRKTGEIVQELKIPLDAYRYADDDLARELRSNGISFGLDTDELLANAESGIMQIASELKGITLGLDPTLLDPLEKTARSALRPFEQFLGKLKKAAYLRDSVIMNRIERVRSLIFPLGNEQERELSLASVYARTGPSFLDTILERAGGYDGEVQILRVEQLG